VVEPAEAVASGHITVIGANGGYFVHLHKVEPEPTVLIECGKAGKIHISHYIAIVIYVAYGAYGFATLC